MFDKDFWQEVLQTIVQQKWRSLMTAFGIFWGLLMLMFLIGAGVGFQEGIVGQLKQMPANSVAFSTDVTTMAYNGLERGRSWTIDFKDVEAIRAKYPGAIRQAVYVKFLPSADSTLTVSSTNATDELVVAGVSPFLAVMSPQRIVSGRYINEFDCDERRKVCVIGNQVAKTLFPDDESPVGQSINIAGTSYDIVGVTKKTNDMVNLGPHESKSVFLPITTAQYVFNAVEQADRLFLVLDDKYDSGDYYKPIDAIIRQHHQIHPDDDVALMSNDLKSQLNQFDIMIGGINALVWLVGLGTLLAGLIGISNIMMITVKERTQEIGVRRALGAEPWTIIKQIMCESLMLTLAAGIVGLIAGVWGLYAVNRMTAASMSDGGFFTNPHVPFIPAIAALIILIIGGLFAGFVPAKRAMAIKAIEALREE